MNYVVFAIGISINRIVVCPALVDERNAADGIGNLLVSVIDGVLDAGIVGDVGQLSFNVFCCIAGQFCKRHNNVRLRDSAPQRRGDEECRKN